MNNDQTPAEDSLTWIPMYVQTPPNGRVVWTKLEDEKGARNIQRLRRSDRLWFTPEQQNAMYVYYTPTHWIP